MSEAVISLQQVSAAGRLRPVSVEFPAGQLIGLIGPNGSGKTTLLEIASGLLETDAGGEVRWLGEDLSGLEMMERARRMAWVPQEVHFEFGFTVRSVVGQGRFARGDDGAGVEEALTRMDLTALADRPVNRLSGGERQRVLLARALVAETKVQLWDEPLSALDVRHRLEVLRLAKGLTDEGRTVVFSLHDLNAAFCLDQVVVMHEGALRAMGPPEEVLTPDCLAEVFGVKSRTGPTTILELP